jgi:hypothetical protein
LADLLAEYPDDPVFFVEDRLPTLLDVIGTPSLKTLQLGFAAWGYNTDADKHTAQQQAGITYLASPETIPLS